MAAHNEVQLWFNGEVKVSGLFSGTKAACEAYARSRDYLKQRGEVFMVVTSTSKSVKASLVEEDKRTVKPMGWGFKQDWALKPGKPAVNLSTLEIKPAFRRI
jgi:hypothetical protein